MDVLYMHYWFNRLGCQVLSLPNNFSTPFERMCLDIKNPIVQTNSLHVIKNQVQIFQCLRQPETLLLIPFRTSSGTHYVSDCTVAVRSTSGLGNMFESGPSSVLIYFITREAVRVK